MILELTLMNGKKILVNFDLVTDVTEDKGKTIVGFGQGNYFLRVEETYEYIKENWR